MPAKRSDCAHAQPCTCLDPPPAASVNTYIDPEHAALPPPPPAPAPPIPDAPLTVKDLKTFLDQEGRGLGRKFVGWAVKQHIAKDDILDAVQDALLRLLQRIHSGRCPAAHIKPEFLMRCGQRDVLKKHLRKTTALPLDMAEASVRHTRHRPEETRKAMLDALPQALGKMPEEDRILLHLLVVEGLSLKESGRRLHIQRGTAKKRLLRAYRLLRLYTIADGEPANTISP
jgi:RNA polymerase sigma-70 factor (ECF subfamily)